MPSCKLFSVLIVEFSIQDLFAFFHFFSLQTNKKVDITSTLLWEIKQARDVSHENTVRFVGACIDLPRPTVLILTEYCPKGLFTFCLVQSFSIIYFSHFSFGFFFFYFFFPFFSSIRFRCTLITIINLLYCTK